jgi:SEC-C motif-containing protein
MSCPCGIGKDYSSCCAPLHKGEQKAKTAEQLMRSRYCAFAKEEIDYVINTQDSASRDELNRQEIEIWSKESDWKNIEIVETQDGLEKDEQGVVEFKATYVVGDKEVVHHERSTFKKEDGDWYFVEGDVLRDQVKRAGPKIGRNDPCLCGSGKKYKKCCL